MSFLHDIVEESEYDYHRGNSNGNDSEGIPDDILQVDVDSKHYKKGRIRFFLSTHEDMRPLPANALMSEIITTNTLSREQYRQQLFCHLDEDSDRDSLSDDEMEKEDGYDDYSESSSVIMVDYQKDNWWKDSVIMNRYIIVSDYYGLRVFTPTLSTIHSIALSEIQSEQNDVFGFQCLSIPMLSRVFPIFVLKTWIVKNEYEDDSENDSDDDGSLTDDDESLTDNDGSHYRQPICEYRNCVPSNVNKIVPIPTYIVIVGNIALRPVPVLTYVATMGVISCMLIRVKK